MFTDQVKCLVSGPKNHIFAYFSTFCVNNKFTGGCDCVGGVFRV